MWQRNKQIDHVLLSKILPRAGNMFLTSILAVFSDIWCQCMCVSVPVCVCMCKCVHGFVCAGCEDGGCARLSSLHTNRPDVKSPYCSIHHSLPWACFLFDVCFGWNERRGGRGEWKYKCRAIERGCINTGWKSNFRLCSLCISKTNCPSLTPQTHVHTRTHTLPFNLPTLSPVSYLFLINFYVSDLGYGHEYTDILQ